MNIPKYVYWYASVFAYMSALVVMGGCGAALPDAQRATAAGEWRARLPSTPSPFASLAYGHAGSAEVAVASREPATLDEYLKPEYREQARPQRAPSTARVAKPAAPLMAAKTAAPEPVTNELVIASATPQSATAPAASSDAERYAQRDVQSQQQREFKAGDVLIVSLGSILVIVLIVVLLVLLLR